MNQSSFSWIMEVCSVQFNQLRAGVQVQPFTGVNRSPWHRPPDRRSGSNFTPSNISQPVVVLCATPGVADLLHGLRVDVATHDLLGDARVIRRAS